MERIGLLGERGSGKDTLADYLVTHKNYIKYTLNMINLFIFHFKSLLYL
jgi:hypothetical protein